MASVSWLSQEEFLLIHCPKDGQDTSDAMYNFVTTNKAFSSFGFHKTPFDLNFPAFDAPPRKPPHRYSVARLKKWDPLLNDMLIVAGAHSSDLGLLLNSAESISPDQKSVNEFQVATLRDERKAVVPQTTFEEGKDSALIGEALDLSSKEHVVRPAPRLEEIDKSPTPLPAYYVLTHEGILTAWWVVWDKSIEAGTAYHGLTCLGATAEAGTPLKAAPQSPAPNIQQTQATSVFGQPTATFGTPATPKFGSTGFPGATSVFGKPSQPAFGSTSQVGSSAGPAFGSTGLGNRQSPWGSASQASASQPQVNPFATTTGTPSGFSKFSANTPASGSAFSSFGSANGGQSGFAALGQQKSAFQGASNGFKGLSTEPSFGSTVTVASGTGSTLPSWANTPAQQGGSIFGAGTSSFASTKESDMSDADDPQNRERDEATPTPQGPPTQSKGLFGLGTTSFQLGTTFKGDGSANDNDKTKSSAPSGGSFFGGDFRSALGGTSSKPPATPGKPEQEKAAQEVSTTPATQPKPSNFLFQGTNVGKDSAAPKVASLKEEVVPEDAPLPPDPMTWKPPKTEDDLPPLAGSPPIKVEAPESSEPSSPLGVDDGDDEDIEEGDDEGDDESGDISVEEQEEDEQTEEPSPSDAARRTRPSQSGWALQESARQSPRILPAAPTPPPGRNMAPGPQFPFGQQFKPAHASFNQAPKGSPLSFGQSAISTQTSAPAGFPAPPVAFAASSRTQENLRSPSPVRAVSTSAIGGVRRDPMITSGASLSASIQQKSKPPTPQPQVSDLVDDEDERIRRELSSEIEPSRTLDAFLARQEYNGPSLGKSGHAAQIEIIYRDINNMVDTLGLNWRSLKAFLEYHERPQRYTELNRAALEEVASQGEDDAWFENWSLAEIEDLKKLEDGLEQELAQGRVQNVLDKLGQLARLFVAKGKLETKVNEVRRQMINRKDPEKAEGLRKASLPKELAEQQKALRGEYARLLTLLSQAEEAIILLRTKLASYNAGNGKSDAIPTVDAVKKTINKLIMITEKKNNDITLLESQLRRIGITESSRPNSSSSRQQGTPLRRSRGPRRESPFATPPTSRSKMTLSELNRKAMTPEVMETPTKGYGLYYTPEGSPSTGTKLAKLGESVEDNLEGLRQTAQRRRKIAEGLATALVERGVKTSRVA